LPGGKEEKNENNNPLLHPHQFLLLPASQPVLPPAPGTLDV
jgi:hypothetical protein